VLGCVAVAAALVLYSPRDVRWGAAFAGSVMLVAALARLVLPERVAGMLACRHRYLDAATLALLGLGVVVVGLLVPPPALVPGLATRDLVYPISEGRIPRIS